MGAFFLSASGLGLRQISEMVVTAFFPHTPQTFAMAELIITSAAGAAMSPPGGPWVGSFYAGPALLSVLVVLLGNMGWGQFRNVLPATGPGLFPVLGEVIPLTSHFGELILLAVWSSYLSRPRHLLSTAAWVAAAVALLWSAVALVYLMVIPLPGALAVPFPFFEMTRLVQGGRFLERVDAFWIYLWTMGTTGQVTAALQTTAFLFRDAFRLPDHRGAVLPLAVSVLAIALFPSNQQGAIAAETFFIRRWGFLIALVLPLLIALLARARQQSARPGAGGSLRA